MVLSWVPALLALLATGSARAGEVALAPRPVLGAGQLPIQALPPPPKVVVRETSRYGTVTIDHERHVALRVACGRCHGPGAVSRIVFTAQVAHERCVGCHEEASRGPVRCAGCHARSRPGEEAGATPAADREPDVEPPSPLGRHAWRARRLGGAAPSPDAPAAAGSVPNAFAPGDPAQDIRSPSAGPIAPAPAAPGRFLERPTLLEFGLNVGAGLGGSLRLSSAEGRTTRSYGVERVADSSSARMLLLVGLGTRWPLLPRVEASGSVIAGFDAQERPRLGFAPSLGTRLGLDWHPPAGWPVRSVQLSLTCTIGFARDAIGAQTSGPRVFATLSTGLRPPSS